MNRVAVFLGLKRSTVGLLLMVILVGMGERMAERFLPIYLLAVGGGILSIGVLNGSTNFVNAIYAFIGGAVSDRLGYKRALLFFNLLSIVGYLLVILVPVWQAAIAGSFFFLSWTAISLPATMDLVAKNLPQKKRTMGVSMHSLVRRIPMALGPVAGGALIMRFGERDGVRLAFSVAALLAAFSIVVQQKLIVSAPARGGRLKSPLAYWRLMTPALRNLLLSDILIRFCEQIPYAFVVVWCLENVGISAIQFGFLTAIEMGTAMLIYVPTAYLADRGARKPFVLITFLFFSAFPAVLYFSHSFVILVIAFVIRGFKEFGEPTRKALILDLAPEDEKAGMFGAYYLGRDLVVSIAAFGGAFLWELSPAFNFFGAAFFGLAGSIFFLFFGRDDLRQPGIPQNPPPAS